jgi:hydroxymethylglutaryl-CoA lyase
MKLPDIIIQEVGPRDGLQIEAKFVVTDAKIAMIEAIAATGVRRIEVTSFVSPKAVPSLRDASEVFAGIRKRPGTVYSALVANLRGAERAIAAKADELNFVMSASETHNVANVGMTPSQSLTVLAEVVRLCSAASVLVNATIATAFGCPFEGVQAREKILGIIRDYLDLGAAGVTLADTTGMANPVAVDALVSDALFLVPPDRLTLHFHDTRGLGLLNVDAARRAGATRFDASLGGLGGCPFAPGASGNVCTEDLVNFLHETDIDTGIDLRALIDVSHTLPGLIGHATAGQIAKAGLAKDLHPSPFLARSA